MQVQDIYKTLNEKSKPSYEEGLKAIGNIRQETQEKIDKSEKDKALKQDDKLEFYKVFNNISKVILKASDIEEQGGGYFNKSFKELKQDNEGFYKEQLPENYETSILNPAYAVGVFGTKTGKLMSHFNTLYLNHLSHAVKQKVFKMDELNNLFINVFNYVKNNDVKYTDLKNAVIHPLVKPAKLVQDRELYYKENFNKNYTFLNNIIMNSDLNDLRYLYRLGVPITENEIFYAKHMLELPEKKIKKLSKTLVNGFIEGFVVKNKDRAGRTTLRLLYNVGEERLVKQIIQDFKEEGINVTVTSADTTSINRQLEFDHGDDINLYLNKNFVQRYLNANKKAAQNCSDILTDNCGPIWHQRFGEQPFSPVEKKERIRLAKGKHELKSEYEDKPFALLYEKYTPFKNRGFAIISFPTGEMKNVVGEKAYKEVYDTVYKINTLDNKKYEKIQQTIIEALDKGEYVRFKGKGNNETDLIISLNKLEDPTKQTNFYNSLANVNIPLGEVYTSPKLNGTSGVLHYSSLFVKGMEIKDLKLVIENGIVVGYSCKNFKNEKDNMDFVRKYLFENREKLPIGEFAIGTNTLAYALAKKFNIGHLFATVIEEKQGVHLAVGDTCFRGMEKTPVYNFDNREMVARENEETKNKNYSFVHNDMTMKYDDIEAVEVVTKEGETIEIIKDGKYVLPGTEELNKPLIA